MYKTYATAPRLPVWVFSFIIKTSGLVFFSRNLKKAVTFLRQKRRTTQQHTLLGCGLGVSGVLRAASGFTPVLDCFVVLAVGVWLMRTGAAYPQRSDSPSRLWFFSAFIWLGPARVGQQTLLEGSFRSPLSVS